MDDRSRVGCPSSDGTDIRPEGPSAPSSAWRLLVEVRVVPDGGERGDRRRRRVHPEVQLPRVDLVQLLAQELQARARSWPRFQPSEDYPKANHDLSLLVLGPRLPGTKCHSGGPRHLPKSIPGLKDATSSSGRDTRRSTMVDTNRETGKAEVNVAASVDSLPPSSPLDVEVALL